MIHDDDRLAQAIEAAERWAIHDPDAVTRSAIDRLVDSRSPELVELFEGRVTFGTSGLRAEVGPGPQRMGALVVRQTTAALVDWLVENPGESSGGAEAPDEAVGPTVLVGFDGRRDSQRFAEHCAASIVARGGRAVLGDSAAPTPSVVHAIKAGAAAAAVVITASHNPAADNGYKLYLSDGMAPVAPVDTEIAARIDELARRWHQHGPAIDDAYAARQPADPGRAATWIQAHRDSVMGFAAELATVAEPGPRSLKLAYTPMHGVGGAAMVDALVQAGFDPPLVVDSQFGVDPDFSTVRFPNPEEAGALDALVELARTGGCDAAMANDPDADRLALVVRDRSGDDFVALNGDELGVLLGDFVLARTSGSRMVARSVVSSRLLDRVAADYGVETAVTLTGFKWIARSRDRFPGRRWVFGYEEAIGYGFGDAVGDKDGIAAGVIAALMLSELAGAGLTVWDRLDRLAMAHGVFESTQVSLRFDDDPAQVSRLMERLESDPPASIASEAVAHCGPVGLGELPPASGVHLLGESDTQVIVRPSGTEPKLKAYIEVIRPIGERGIEAARASATRQLAVAEEWVRSLLSGL